MTLPPGLTVAVAGLGPMGRGIARAFDRAGARVIVSDVTLEVAERGLEQIRAEAETDGETVSIAAASLEESLADATLFIEAIVENMEIKKAMLADVARFGHDGLIVASNTSSLSIGEMGHAFGDPSRVIGTHFFNPPTKMRLVEVILGAATSPEVHRRVLDLVEAIGKTAITCADSPNFVVNRICRPLYYEAQLLTTQGVEPAAVDAVARGALGHRMGPLQLLDFTGLHTHLASSETAHREFGEDRYRPIPKVRGLVRNGMTGRAAGRGFYDYAVESPRDGQQRVTIAPPEVERPGAIAVAGPDAHALLDHPVVKPLVRQSAPMVVYACHGAPTSAGLAELGALRQHSAVVVDSSDAAWLYALPADVGWVRLHAWRDDVFAEVVDDPAAGVEPTAAVNSLLAALHAASVRVPALPGLVADRLANCLANEACLVAEEGTATPDDINVALRLGMNHPVGPLEYIDRVGVRTVYAGLRSLLETFGDPRYRPTQLMRRQDAALARES